MTNWTDYEKISLDWREESADVFGRLPDFPRYTTQIINLANQNAGGTRPRVVGQMSDLIQEFPGNTYDDWKDWYVARNPDAIDRAVGRIMPMIEGLREAIDRIDAAMVRRWVEDLVLTKTAEGLAIQEIVLKALAERENISWRLAGPDDEAKNIDGYLGDEPVSIKPETYLTKRHAVREEIPVEIIYYKKTAKYLHIFRKKAQS